jgi:acetolactate synthase regulatory subunit
VAKSRLPFRLFGKLELLRLLRLLRLRGWQIVFVHSCRLRPLEEVQLKIGVVQNLSLELLLVHIEVLQESLK